MRVATCAVVVVAALLAGCGGGDGRRETVNDYIERIDSAQGTLLMQKGQIDLALRRFDLVHPQPKDLAALTRAEEELRRVASDVRAVTPPVEARRLHDDVLRLLDKQADVAHDLAWAGRYTPRLRTAVGPLGDATTRLARDLKDARGARASAAAFAAYRTSLTAILHDLEPLDAPPVFRPSLDSQRRTLRRSVALSSEIEAALRRGDASGVAAGLRALSALASDAQAVRARQAEIAAAKAYNRRLAEIGKLAVKVEQDRRALDTSID